MRKKQHKNSPKTGWYRIRFPEKYMKPADDFMKSYRLDDKGNIMVEYKSNLERKAIVAMDYSNGVTKWGIEPFAINYVKPTDGKSHRYYIDMIVFMNGTKYLVEIKPLKQVKKPRKPNSKTQTQKQIDRYMNECMTYSINTAKWEAAKTFASKQLKCEFIILTEEDIDKMYNKAMLSRLNKE